MEFDSLWQASAMFWKLAKKPYTLQQTRMTYDIVAAAIRYVDTLETTMDFDSLCAMIYM